MAMPAAGVRRDHSSMCCVKHALRDLLGKYLYTALCFFLLEKNAMFTTESFCNLVWGTSYLKVLRKIRFLYKGIIINHNKKLSQPTLKRRFFKKKAAFFSWPGLGKEWC